MNCDIKSCDIDHVDRREVCALCHARIELDEMSYPNPEDKTTVICTTCIGDEDDEDENGAYLEDEPPG